MEVVVTDTSGARQGGKSVQVNIVSRTWKSVRSCASSSLKNTAGTGMQGSRAEHCMKFGQDKGS